LERILHTVKHMTIRNNHTIDGLISGNNVKVLEEFLSSDYSQYFPAYYSKYVMVVKKNQVLGLYKNFQIKLHLIN
jgi:hypothetical protein